MRNMFLKLRQRKVFRVLAAYAVAAWLLVQVADVALPAFDAPAWILRAFIVLVALGFPIAAVLAWLFEVSSDGVRRTPPETGSAPALKTSSFEFALAVVLVAAVGYSVYRTRMPELVFSDPPTVDVTVPVPGFSGRAAIAVLPFVNMSDDPEQEYFADGITEDILTGLQAWRTFPVISRNSSFVYKGKAVDVRTVGEELGVGYVLEGSVRKFGDKVRITAQLIDARTDAHLWAERYDRELEDVFEVQDEITLNIVSAIAPEIVRSEMSRVAAVRTQDMQAYDYLLQANSLMQDGVYESAVAARELLLKALESDPRFSPAYATLAWIEHDLAVYHRDKVSDESSEQGLQRALDYAKTAVKLAPTLSRGRSIYGHLLSMTTASDAADLAIVQNEEAVRLNPSDALARANLGGTLCVAEKLDESLAELAMAKRLSPNDPGMWWFLEMESCALRKLGRHDEAIRSLHRAQELRPGNHFIYIYEIFVLIKAGREVDAQERLNALRVRFPELTLDIVRRSLATFDMYVEGVVETVISLDWKATLPGRRRPDLSRSPIGPDA